jgi:small subunit ribosomal protein MRP21
VPRPPPIQRNTFFIDPKQRAQAQSSQTQSQQTNNVTITDPAQLPSQIRADMEKHTTANNTISSIAAGLGSPGTLWKEDDFLQRYFGPQQADPRLRPSTGRTINVRGNIDPGRAFALLEKSCARNKVRNDMYKQREHERPGLKRKRLKSERWRTRFKFAMNAVIKRTLELRSQGW